MSFTTNVYRDGRWVSEEVTLDSLRRPSDSKSQRQPAPTPPRYGVVTTTVVESPLVHTILPVRLRSAEHVDVALIGDHFLQICELQTTRYEPPNVDCQYYLKDIARKTDFNSRIRSAKVIGQFYDGKGEGEIKDEDAPSKPEPDMDDLITGVDFGSSPISHPPSSSQESTKMPPQLLAIVLENGHCVFLCMRIDASGEYHFESSTFNGPPDRLFSPGFHFAVDPSSRYMALGCFEDIFAVYELESRATLEQRFAQGLPLNPVRAWRPRTVNGVIHKMDFLYPNPADDYHVILLLIIIRDGRSKMVVYDWEAYEEDLKDVLAVEKKGHSLPREHQMPVLIIPLAVQNAFFAISADSIAVCRSALTGSADFENFQLQDRPPTEFHHGNGRPLWTAWARPLRTRDHSHEAGQDHIYLAREDGALTFLEIESENILAATVSLELLNGNIATAFGSVPAPFADVLLMGGDSGPGGMYEIGPRRNPTAVALIPNWSPAVDLATTDKFSHWSQELKDTNDSAAPWRQSHTDTIEAPDRVFAASGRGVKGSITEFRMGIQGTIHVPMDVSEHVKRSWLLPTTTTDGTFCYHLLITTTGRSLLLQTPVDFSDHMLMLEDEETPYDLSSTTLAAAEVEVDARAMIVQVTEKSIVIVTPDRSSKHHIPELLDLPDVTVLDAVVSKNFIALSTHVGPEFRLYTLRLSSDMSLLVAGSCDVQGEVTCLDCINHHQPYIIAGIWDGGKPRVSIISAGSDDMVSLAVSMMDCLELDDAVNSVQKYKSSLDKISDRLNSIVCLPNYDHDNDEVHQKFTVVAGSRCGEVVSLTYGCETNGPWRPLASQDYKIGARSVDLCVVDDTAPIGPGVKYSVLACCDLRAVMMSRLCLETSRFGDIDNVWPIDVMDETRKASEVSSTTMLRQGLIRGVTGRRVLFASGTEVLLVELHPAPRAIPRTFPIGATPTKLLYVPTLDCLVVAVKVDNKVSLRFLDPATGEDLSSPGDGTEANPRVSGLDKPGDAVHDLSEWDFRRSGDAGTDRQWTYILVSLHSGKLLVLSTKTLAPERGASRGKISFWTRLKKRNPRPVHCALGSGENIFFCAGDTLHWEKLDPITKTLASVDTFQLPSPAVSLRLMNGRIVALTSSDSVQVIELEGGLGRPLPAGSGSIGDGQTLLTSLRHAAPTASDGAAHMIELIPDVGGARIDMSDEDGEQSPEDTTPSQPNAMVLIADRACGAESLWIPWLQSGRNCVPMLQARLPASIRKFARAKTRPCWQPTRTRENAKYGVVPTRADGAELLGLCLDGSVQHFSLVDEQAWNVLQTVQRILATDHFIRTRDRDRDGTDWEEFMSPDFEKAELDNWLHRRTLSMYHVDGDALRRELRERTLDGALRRLPESVDWLWRALRKLIESRRRGDVEDAEVHRIAHGGDDGEVDMGEADEDEGARQPEGLPDEKRLGKMVELVYAILEYHMAPVL